MLDPLLQEGVTRKILKEGIKLRRRVYYHSDLFDPTLVNRDIDSVVVRIQPGDVAPDEIEVYAGGHWLCTAVAVTSPKGRLVTREEVAVAQRRQRRGLQAQVKRAHLLADEASVSDMDDTGAPSRATGAGRASKVSSRANVRPGAQPRRNGVPNARRGGSTVPSGHGRRRTHLKHVARGGDVGAVRTLPTAIRRDRAVSTEEVAPVLSAPTAPAPTSPKVVAEPVVPAAAQTSMSGRREGGHVVFPGPSLPTATPNLPPLRPLPPRTMPGTAPLLAASHGGQDTPRRRRVLLRGGVAQSDNTLGGDVAGSGTTGADPGPAVAPAWLVIRGVNHRGMLTEEQKAQARAQHPGWQGRCRWP